MVKAFVKGNKKKPGNKNSKSKKNNGVVKNKAKKPTKAIKAVVLEPLTQADIDNKYPILKDKALIEKFLKVTLSNNQKGRLRQTLRDQLKCTSEELLPDLINNKILSITDSCENLTEPELRKIRLLYNMLKTTVEKRIEAPLKELDEEALDKSNSNEDTKEDSVNKVDGGEVIKKIDKKVNDDKGKKENVESKHKGPKRYVVFVGNLPLTVDKDKLKDHFRDISAGIKDIRIPTQAESKKSGIAYIEVANETFYELALSKHHSMFNNKRINVFYTAQQNGKISKTEAKGKAAKLVALQKTGKLIGSVPLNKKRSFRRKKLKEARAKENTD